MSKHITDDSYKDPYTFVLDWCVALTDDQLSALTFNLDHGGFLGAARAIGNMEYWPMIETDGKSGPYVLNKEGNYEPAAEDGRIYYCGK